MLSIFSVRTLCHVSNHSRTQPKPPAEQLQCFFLWTTTLGLNVCKMLDPSPVTSSLRIRRFRCLGSSL
jgi:hypothetical protein